MKKLLSLLVMLLLAASPALALVEGLNGSDVAVLSSTPATSISAGKWYVFYNAGRKVYTYGTTYQTSTAPTAVAVAAHSADYMLRIVESGTEGRYYIQNAKGEYLKPLANSAYTGVTANKSQAATFTFNQIGNNAGHWYLTCSNGLVMDSDGGSMVGYGSGIPTQTGVNKDYNLYEVTFPELGSLTASQRALYDVDKGGLFRIRNHRTSDKYVNEITNTNKGNATTKNTSEAQRMSQMWIVETEGTGYSLRNAQTGNYLQSDYTCTTDKYAWTIALSPNNTQETDLYFVICHGVLQSGKLNCLNISNGGTNLTDWSYNGDTGSEWLFEAVESTEVSSESVKANLDKICNVNEFDLAQGTYYTFTNLSSGELLTQNTATNALGTMDRNENSWAQYWKVVEVSNGKYTLQNVASKQYITLSSNGNYTATDNATTNSEWQITAGSYDWHTIYNIINPANTNTSISGSNSQLGSDELDATTSQWILRRIALSEDDVDQANKEYQEQQALLNADRTVLNQNLLKYFSDYACTTLNETYSAMTDEELISAMTTDGLPSLIYNIALKVKNNSWAKREQEFRVYAYEPYSDPTQWHKRELIGTSYQFSPQSGPTGISVKEGDFVMLFVGADAATESTLKFSSCEDYEIAPAQTELKKGINLYTAPKDGFLFIHHVVTNTARKLADFAPITVHIEGGRVQGYFDITRRHKNADWKDFTQTLFKDKIVHLKSKYYQFNMDYQGLLKQITESELDEIDTDGIAKGIEGTLHRWDQLVESERSIMGVEQFEGRFNCVLSASSSSNGNPYAGSYGTYYPGVGTIMNYSKMTHGAEYDEGANYWCIAHETGHVHQNLINLAGCTEISNNLFSQIATWNQGSNVSRYRPWSTTQNHFNKRQFWHDWDDKDTGTGQPSRMFYQLWLYFHLAGNNTEFYPAVFDMFRKSPIVYSTDPNKPGSGTTDYLKFAKFCCDAAQADLSEFFRFWGFFVPIENYVFDDYGNKYMTTTQAEIDEAIAYMQKYEKKLGNILFIDDRITEYPANYPGMPEGAMRLATTTGVTPGNSAQMGELGMFTDFGEIDNPKMYDCEVNEQAKQVIVDRTSGNGAVGFKVYNAKHELVYVANTYIFTLPEDIFNAGFYIMAAVGNGTDIPIYDNTDLINFAEYAVADVKPYAEQTGYFTFTAEAKQQINWQESYNNTCHYAAYKAMKKALATQLSNINARILPENGYYRLANKAENSDNDQPTWVSNISGEVESNNKTNNEGAHTIIKIERKNDAPLQYSLKLQNEYIAPSANESDKWYTINVNTSDPTLLGWAKLVNGNQNLNSNAGKVGHEASDYDASYWTIENAETFHITLNQGQGEYWATMYTPFGFTLPEGTEAFIGKVNEEQNSLNLISLDRNVPAGTPVVLKGNSPSIIANIDDKVTGDTKDNDLTGQYLAYAEPTNSVYTLGIYDGLVGFYKYTDIIGANKAVLRLPAGTSANGFKFIFGDEITGIDAAGTALNSEQATYYDLQGRRVVAPQKGSIYIVNGKTVVY